MNKYTQKELQEAVIVIASIIGRCEKAQIKFKEGTSQHSLLRNRIKALRISKSLVEGEQCIKIYTMDEVNKALAPVISIRNKCEKAQQKFDIGTPNHTRFVKLISTMYIAEVLLMEHLRQSGE